MCLNPGDILRDRYQIIRQLGEGGFARTYTANDLEQPDNSPCVVKEIKPPQSTDPEVLQRARTQFQTEAAALYRLGEQHSRIPNLIDSFENNGRFYLIQQYIPGQPLSKELTSSSRWTQEQVVFLLQEILSIIQFVHDRGMVHRDIHPGNLIRRACNNSIVLIDFGAVREISTLGVTNSGEISTTQAIGIRGYMPAEQLLMPWNPQKYNDIYAIGAIAVQALTQIHPNNLPRDPFSCELLWHFSTPDRDLPQVSDSLRSILNKMVRFPYCERYQSAADVLLDLASVTELQPPPIHPLAIDTESDTSFRKPQIRRSIAIALVAATGSIAIYRSILSPKTALAFKDGLSAGEEILFANSSTWLKKQGVEELAASNSKQALKNFQESWQKEYNKDPETLVYANNAFLEANQIPYYTIAVTLPIASSNPDSPNHLGDRAKEVLRGVAQAQTEVNLKLANSRGDRDFPGQSFLPSQAINGKGLKVVIADDANNESEAKKTASLLVKQPDILAVIGHTNSDMTMAAVDVYDRNNLVLMSSGASTEDLTYKPRKFFFRTQYTSSLIAKDLANFLLAKNQKQAVIIYNPANPYSASFKQEFSKYFGEINKKKIVRIREFDLSKKDFNAQKAIKEIEAKGETAIALVPDAKLTNSLKNAFDIIKLNQDRNWIVGAWTLMRSETLEIASQWQQKSFKKLILSVGWHPLNSPNKEFPQQARSLWGGEVNTRTASAYDATRALIKALEMQPNPTRAGMQKMLSSPEFSAEGATGIIHFNSPHNGDRKNPPSDLVHIVECAKEQFNLTFVPVKYPTAKAAGLKCDL